MEYLKEAMFPLVYVQQTNMQDKVQEMLIQIHKERERKESQEPWYKKKWSHFTEWINSPLIGNPPSLPPNFWDTSVDETNELEPSEAEDDDGGNFYGDDWPIVTFLFAFSTFSGAWLITVFSFYLFG